jgi:hypothetical protein
MPRHRNSPDRRRGAPLWLPWLVAPAFMLLPIGGCGLAESFVRGDPRALQSAPAPAPAEVDDAGTWRMVTVLASD